MKYPNIGQGPWDNEPDRLEFEAHGLRCVISRTEHSGNLCGYVRIGEAHPLFGVGYHEKSDALAEALTQRTEMPIGKMPPMTLVLCSMDDDIPPTPDVVFDVHGGITYSGEYPCGWFVTSERSGALGFAPNEGWWFGFDCAHCNDMSPGGHERHGWSVCRDEVYRDMDYVKSETERLAKQLVELTPIVEP